MTTGSLRTGRIPLSAAVFSGGIVMNQVMFQHFGTTHELLPSKKKTETGWWNWTMQSDASNILVLRFLRTKTRLSCSLSHQFIHRTWGWSLDACCTYWKRLLERSCHLLHRKERWQRYHWSSQWRKVSFPVCNFLFKCQPKDALQMLNVSPISLK